MAALFGDLLGFFDFRRDTIDYVATKQSGLTATSTRTIIISSPTFTRAVRRRHILSGHGHQHNAVTNSQPEAQT
jgi:hypothetical protein